MMAEEEDIALLLEACVWVAGTSGGGDGGGGGTEGSP